MSDVVLDKSGNIDNRRLEQSLRQALDFDTKYKQKDNMKKKACKVAGSYDEFKAMVDCAHLKRVTRKEIDSLGLKKQGWSKSNTSKNGSIPSILSSEESKNKISEGYNEAALLNRKCKHKPKTPLELCRDLRRLRSDDDKLR
jgi:hypothetical protein